MELDLVYEGFEISHDNARPLNEVAHDRSIECLGSLPRVHHEPLLPRKKTSPKKRPHSAKDFLAVGPIREKAASKKRRGSGGNEVEDDEMANMVQGDNVPSVCVAGDLCERPGGSSSLLMHRQKCVTCFQCKAMGHITCLVVKYNMRLCRTCLPIVRKTRINRARAALNERLDSLLPNHLEPPPELLSLGRFERPNITKKMKETLDYELSYRDFPSQDEMAATISAHNSELEKLRNDPHCFTTREKHALRKKDERMKSLVYEWKKCFQQLKRDYVKSTRCCVKALRFDPKLALFEAHVEWEESATEKESGVEITVINSDVIRVKGQWVQDNFTRGTFDYLQNLSRLGKGKFMPVPKAQVFMDTRQITHFKFTGGRWFVRFASHGNSEEVTERDLVEAVGAHAMNMAKTFGRGKKGFIPIPVGNSTSSRAVGIVCDVEIAFRQEHRQTCVYSSFASALWFLGFTDLALCVISYAASSQGDPFALRRLAKVVRDHPFWMSPKKIKNAATFNLLEHDLTNELAVVVLRGIPDRACNHAVTVFDGLIFDSNEKFAIPLTQANLDLVCSTDRKKAKFECVAAGYLFVDSRPDGFGIRDRTQVTNKAEI